MKGILKINNLKETIKQVFLSVIIAFITLQICHLITSDVRSLFTTLDISLSTLPLECVILIALTIFFYILNKHFSLNTIIMVSAVWSLYLVLLSIISSSVSIGFGVLLLQMPALFVVTYWWSNNKQNCLKANKFLYYVTLFFLGILIIRNVYLLFFKVSDENIIKLFSRLATENNLPAAAANGEILVVIGLIISIIVMALLFLYYWMLNKNEREYQIQNNRIHKVAPVLISILILAFFVFRLSEIMYFMTIGLRTPTYDMGIFSQMFHSMAEGNGPLTTLERDGLLSHFAVHISPIYYLMLPFYMIWPKPETLQILQVLIVASGVVPFFLIAKTLKVPPKLLYLIVCLYAVAPGLIGSSLYNVHENCFLAPCILWLIYFILKDKNIGLFVFTALILCIKEDAVLYLIFIGLYFIVQKRFPMTNKKKLMFGFVLILIPLLYFAIAAFCLSRFGDGVMTWRYNNLIAYPQLGFIGIPITIFQNLTYVISTMLTSAKVSYILIILGSIGLLPLMQKTYREYLLMIPFVVMNLISDYQYQYDIHFQYHYGTGVLLLFMALLVIADAKSNFESAGILQYHTDSIFNKNRKSPKIIAILCAGAITFGMFQSAIMLDIYSGACVYYQNNQSAIESIKTAIDQIPVEDSVLASPFFTTYLSNRDPLYDAQYHNQGHVDNSIDWVVLDKRFEMQHQKSLINAYMSTGYNQSSLSNKYVIILEHPSGNT